jgi:hypothetical protein
MQQLYAQNQMPSSGGYTLSKYSTSAYLNAEGKKVWGGVFPDGEVPVQSIIAQSGPQALAKAS